MQTHTHTYTHTHMSPCAQGATAFILVPYLDSKQDVKLAGFLLQF